MFRLAWLVLLFAALNPLMGQEAFDCRTAAVKWQNLQKEYKFSEMEALSDRAVKHCSIGSDSELFHLAAVTYLWRGELTKAHPIVAQIVERAKAQVPNSAVISQVGTSNYIPILYNTYLGAAEKVEEALTNFETINFKSQEVALTYLLRRNDKRFLDFYQIRKQTKRDFSSTLCKIYCKRNARIKDCPCGSEPSSGAQGGPYAIYEGFLNGKPAEELKKEINAHYSDAPLLKKEILECLGME